MSDSALARRPLVEDFVFIGLVLEAYKAVMARSRNERDAFETAVHVYRTQSSDLPEKDARRAVADIICGKQRSGDKNSFSESPLNGDPSRQTAVIDLDQCLLTCGK
jgi:hypothetical protein